MIEYPLHADQFNDQFAFRPTGLTTCARVNSIHILVDILQTYLFVHLITSDFFWAFDSVCHSNLSFSLLLIEDTEQATTSGTTSGIRHYCEYCFTSYSTPSNLRHHYAAHLANNSKPCVCPECGRIFVHTSSLNAHVKSHREPWTCLWCGRIDTTPEMIRKHLASHTQAYVSKSLETTSSEELEISSPIQLDENGILVIQPVSLNTSTSNDQSHQWSSFVISITLLHNVTWLVPLWLIHWLLHFNTYCRVKQELHECMTTFLCITSLLAILYCIILFTVLYHLWSSAWWQQKFDEWWCTR